MTRDELPKEVAGFHNAFVYLFSDYSDRGVFGNREDDQLNSVLLDGTAEAAPAGGEIVLLSVMEGALMRTVARTAGRGAEKAIAGIAAGTRVRVHGRLAAGGGALAVDAASVAAGKKAQGRRDMDRNDLNSVLLDGTVAADPKASLGRRASPDDKAALVLRTRRDKLVDGSFKSVLHEVPVVCLGHLARQAAREVRAGDRLRVFGRLAMETGAGGAAAVVAADNIELRNQEASK